MKIPIHKILQDLGIDDLDLKNEKEVEEFKKELQFWIEESERDYDNEDNDWGKMFADGLNEHLREEAEKEKK